MRDVKAGRDINVKGDFVVKDQTQQYKLLIYCTNEELLDEEQHRHRVLADERCGKPKRAMVGFLIAACLLFAAAVYFWFQEQMNLFSFLSGAAGFLLALLSLRYNDEPTVFEQRQIDTLNEIHMLLRERGVRR